ncbi:PulJ/GspJ family protein [Epibacterium ulvae]|uniref:PulJ/GspJ family protein n=1 Tax=Epibacterium ulvae TaxID=1156985 RepID=UPI0024934F3D|nr:prepilin-type N-terminal cleavage/methylation domain-containing protein [Epibacterium ulvae]
MPSKKPLRSSNAGLTLLEVMLAFAIMGMVLATSYSLSIRLMSQQISTQEEYELSVVARAVLEEYILTYPKMPMFGSYENTWDWRIEEKPQEVLEPTDYDYYFEFIHITAQIRKRNSNTRNLGLSTVVARRAPDI